MLAFHVVAVCLTIPLIGGQGEEWPFSEEPLTKFERAQVSQLPGHYTSHVRSKLDEKCMLRHICTRCSGLRNAGISSDEITCDGGARCSDEQKIATKTQRVKICNPAWKKICPNQPCPTCPLFCQANKQTWCKDEFKVMTRRIAEEHCNEGRCKVVERSEDFITPGRRCYEKMLEPLCTTIDCEFQRNRNGDECAQTTRMVNVTLRTKTCSFCHTSKLTKNELCTSITGRPCAKGFVGKWIKTCGNATEKSRVPRNNDEDFDQNEVLPITELFDMASRPARKLLNPARGQKERKEEKINSTEKPVTTTPEFKPFDMTNLTVLNERGTPTRPENEENIFVVNGQIIPLSDSDENQDVESNEINETADTVYFDPRHNVVTISGVTSGNEFQDTSITEFPTTTRRTFAPSITSKKAKPTSTTTGTFTPTTETAEANDRSFTSTTSLLTSKTNSITKTTAEFQTTTRTTLSTTSTESKSTSTTAGTFAPTTETANPNDRNLTSTTSFLTATTNDIVKTTGQPSSPPNENVTGKPEEFGISLRQQARLCLFEGICDTQAAERYFRTSTSRATTIATSTATTITTSSTTTTPSPSSVNKTLLAQIQRCIQTPKFCNTDILMPTMSNSTTSNRSITDMPKTTTESSTTTTITTAPTERRQNLSENPRSNLGLRVRLCLFNHIC